MRRVPGALQRLTACLNAAEPQVRMFGALALAAFDRPRALERLAIEAKSPEEWHRNQASEFLLQLGDRRGIPARLEILAGDLEAAHSFACRDLRVYTNNRCHAMRERGRPTARSTQAHGTPGGSGPSRHSK
jgi:hypothetical protein